MTNLIETDGGAVLSQGVYDPVALATKAVGETRQDFPNDRYGLGMRLSYDEQRRIAENVLKATDLQTRLERYETLLTQAMHELEESDYAYQRKFAGEISKALGDSH